MNLNNFITGVPCRCYTGLGCFTKRSECGEGYFSLLPESPDAIKTSFVLFTSPHGTDDGNNISYNMSKNEFLNSGFDVSRETKIIIHGFIDSADGMERIKDAFLSKVIIIHHY